MNVPIMASFDARIFNRRTISTNASAGNRTRVTSMATMYSTTRPLMPTVCGGLACGRFSGLGQRAHICTRGRRLVGRWPLLGPALTLVGKCRMTGAQASTGPRMHTQCITSGGDPGRGVEPAPVAQQINSNTDFLATSGSLPRNMSAVV